MKLITPALRLKLKKPMGLLFKSTPKARAELKATLSGQTVYAVGDATIQTLFKLGVEPKVRVFDLKTHRKALPQKQAAFLQAMTGRKDAAVNPAGHISPSLEKAAWRAVHTSGPTDLFVIGEEDLAVIPLVMQAESGLVCYGQPKKGLVVVPVNEETKGKAHALYAQFKTARMQNRYGRT